MRIMVVASLQGSLVGFRGELLRTMSARGHDVVAVAPDEREDLTAALADLGARYTTIPMARVGLDPLEDLRTLRALYRLARHERPDVVLAYTAKPVIYGLIGARLARVPLRAAMISGRGTALAGGSGLRGGLLARLMGTLYAVALRGAHVVFFQNPDDDALFRERGLVGRAGRRVRIDGSGVDLDHYPLTPLPDGPTTFLMVGRLLREKGVFEYVEAARQVRARFPATRFVLLGSLDHNPSSITAAALAQLQADGTVEHTESVKDVRPFIAAAHVIVLPSYHEGMPRSVLEGMSMGRAVITTDAPGCRETVVPGRNGLLVPPGDANALAEAMSTLVQDREEVAHMGSQSRLLAEQRFDVHQVNRVILHALAL